MVKNLISSLSIMSKYITLYHSRLEIYFMLLNALSRREVKEEFNF